MIITIIIIVLYMHVGQLIWCFIHAHTGAKVVHAQSGEVSSLLV